MKKPTNPHDAAITLLAPDGADVSLAAADAGGKTRHCKMSPAYSGAVFEHPFFGPTVIDVAGVKVPGDGVPLYRQHDPSLYVGRSTEVNLADAIDVRGFLFVGVEAADEVARISDQNGKWQASIRAEPNLDKIDFIGAESSVAVNGKQIAGPVAVWRESHLREVSFTPRGVDSSTSAVALSHQAAAGAAKKESTMDPVIAERQRAKSIREAFPKHPKFADEQIDKGASLAEAKAAFADIAMAELAEKEKAHEAALAAEKAARADAEKKAQEAAAKLAKPSFAAALGAPTSGGTTDAASDPNGDPIAQYEAALAAECAKVTTDEVAELATRRGIALSDEAHRKALAVARLQRSNPKLTQAYVAATNERGIGSRARNNKAR